MRLTRPCAIHEALRPLTYVRGIMGRVVDDGGYLSFASVLQFTPLSSDTGMGVT